MKKRYFILILLLGSIGGIVIPTLFVRAQTTSFISFGPDSVTFYPYNGALTHYFFYPNATSFDVGVNFNTSTQVTESYSSLGISTSGYYIVDQHGGSEFTQSYYNYIVPDINSDGGSYVILDNGPYSSAPASVSGCMDSTANNYNPLATVSDGSCTYTCTTFTYSAWSACDSTGTQTRIVQSSSPSSCTGGSPVTSQSCTYTPPTPVYIPITTGSVSGSAFTTSYFGTGISSGVDYCKQVHSGIFPANVSVNENFDNMGCGAQTGLGSTVPYTLSSLQTSGLPLVFGEYPFGQENPADSNGNFWISIETGTFGSNATAPTTGDIYYAQFNNSASEDNPVLIDTSNHFGEGISSATPSEGSQNMSQVQFNFTYNNNDGYYNALCLVLTNDGTGVTNSSCYTGISTSGTGNTFSTAQQLQSNATYTYRAYLSNLSSSVLSTATDNSSGQLRIQDLTLGVIQNDIAPNDSGYVDFITGAGTLSNPINTNNNGVGVSGQVLMQQQSCGLTDIACYLENFVAWLVVPPSFAQSYYATLWSSVQGKFPFEYLSYVLDYWNGLSTGTATNVAVITVPFGASSLTIFSPSLISGNPIAPLVKNTLVVVFWIATLFALYWRVVTLFNEYNINNSK